MAKVGAFLKNAWNKEPVVVASCAIGLSALIFPFVSPLTKYSAMLNQVTPTRYPVPMRDDGNMPDVPSHPCDPIGNRMEWFKTF